MPNKLPCEVVQDLLPSYVDGLTSKVTNDAIEEHVSSCTSCHASLDAMCAPEIPQQELEEKKEIDFLKKTKKKTRSAIIISVIVAVIVVAAILFARFYLVGSPLYGQSVACKVDVSGQELTVSGAVVDSGLGVSSIDYEEEDGVVTISFKATLASPIHKGDFRSVYEADDMIKQIKIDDRIIWDQGKTISANVSAVYNAKHPYVGEMPANGDSVRALGLTHVLGGFTNELQTSKEPYGWTLIMENDYSAGKIETIKDKMNAYAYVLIATIDNLNVVTYRYTVDGVAEELTVTAETATAATGKDIKQWGETPAALQELMERYGLDAYAAANQFTGYEAIFVNVVNMSDEVIYDLFMDYCIDGEHVGGTGVAMANNSAIEKGHNIRFELNETNLKGYKLEGATELKLIFAVGATTPSELGTDNSYDVETTIVLNSELGYDYNFVLSGNVDTGFILE